MGDDQVTPGGHGLYQAVHDRPRLVVVSDVMQDRDQCDRDRLGQVQGPRGFLQDLPGIAQVGVDVVGDSLGAAGEQGAGVCQHEGVVIGIDDP